MTNITEEQLEKQLSTLPSLDSPLTPTSELEHQLQCQVINVYNGNQKRKDIISHPHSSRYSAQTLKLPT